MEEIKYIVNDNDTLFEIAKKYNVTVNDIMNNNNLITPLIYPNQILLIPIKTDELINYQTNKDDTIELIAKKYNISPYEIGKYNDFGTIKIAEGESVIIPNKTGTYTVKENDTIETIINNSKRTTRHLMILNQNEWLKPGNIINI